MARRFPLPSFISTKRSKAITVAVAGTLTLATVISVGAAIASSASPLPATDTAFITTVGQQNAVQTTRPAGAVQQAVLVDQARALQAQRHAQQVAAAKVAATKAAATKAAAQGGGCEGGRDEGGGCEGGGAQGSSGEGRGRPEGAPRAQAAVTTPSGTPQQIAKQMLSQYGWSQQPVLLPAAALVARERLESHRGEPELRSVRHPQALPGSQMASAGADWQTNAATQIRWGLTYIQGRYGSPCGAEAHEQADNWY